jgi:hypothetical protein
MTISQDKLPHDNWSFLSLLAQWLNVKRISGKFITIRDGLILTELLNKHSKGATFECTLLPWGQENEVWIRFAENKYAEPVSVGIKPSSNKGWIFIFPQLSNRDRFLTELIGNILPQMFPKLFPYLEGARWVERLDYEIPGVASRLNQIEKIQADARERIDAIEAEIGIERREHGYLHEIIRATGDMLVMAVQRAFEVLGFQDVVNMDEERERMGDTAPRREDLQIRDRSPLLLAEVKGVTGIGTENAKLQVWKYITPRIKQLDRTDIRGLSVLNHERHVPALERNNETPFQADILTNAEEHEIGLITTWDLYRLVRSYLKNGWRHTDVRDLFYQNGRIEPVPTHYEYVGRIIGFIERLGVVGVLLEQGAIKQGDRIAFELPIVFEEQIAESLQIDNIQVEEADQGQTVGILTGLTKQEAKNGIRVFRVLAPTELVPGERKS